MLRRRRGRGTASPLVTSRPSSSFSVHDSVTVVPDRERGVGRGFPTSTPDGWFCLASSAREVGVDAPAVGLSRPGSLGVLRGPATRKSVTEPSVWAGSGSRRRTSDALDPFGGGSEPVAP